MCPLFFPALESIVRKRAVPRYRRLQRHIVADRLFRTAHSATSQSGVVTGETVSGACDADYALQRAHDGEGALELRQVADVEREAHERQLVPALGAHRGHIDLLARQRIADVA